METLVVVALMYIFRMVLYLELYYLVFLGILALVKRI